MEQKRERERDRGRERGRVRTRMLDKFAHTTHFAEGAN